MATVFGIDLGTTYSCIARYNNQHTEKVKAVHPRNAVSGGVILPSVVYYEAESGTPIVGNSAKNMYGVPDGGKRILSFVKRYMGEDNYPEQVLIQQKEITLSPVEGSACILHHLIKCAIEDDKGHGGSPTQKAVITIPASFNNKQRECTKKAAELAGIEVLGLVHEPTAAAIGYGIKSGETILVFDLGGGTLDVSIVTMKRGKYTVLASAGDKDVLKRHLGGKDWDDALMEHIVDKHGYVFGKIPNLEEKSERWRLRNQIEQSKIDLSDNPKVSVNFPDFTSEDVTRVEFNRITDNLVQDCLKVVNAAIEMADKSAKNGKIQIDRCVLAGGSSNMPMIKNALSKYLADRIATGRNESEWLFVSDPHTAIAKGAAFYAEMLEEGKAQGDGVLTGVEDKSSHSYGTSFFRRDPETGKEEKKIKNLIRSTDPMVYTSRNYRFHIRKEGQTSMDVDLFENTCPDEEVLFDEENISKYNISKIYDEPYSFEKEVNITKKTDINFCARRKEDGTIDINISYLGKSRKDFNDIPTIVPVLSNEYNEHILHSIALMDSASEECK